MGKGGNDIDLGSLAASMGLKKVDMFAAEKAKEAAMAAKKDTHECVALSMSLVAADSNSVRIKLSIKPGTSSVDVN